ncbi:F-actin-capping protein subunit alpha [Balamuthia mandrillaris]
MSDAAVKALEARLSAALQRLDQVERQLASGGGAAPAASSSSSSSAGGDGSPKLAAFDAILSAIDEYHQISGQLDPLIKQQADLVRQAWQAHRGFLAVAAKCKKPSDTVLGQLLQPISKIVGEVIEIRDRNRPAEAFNHLSTISEGISCIGWVTVSPTPGPFVDESRASSEFYSNKILMKYRKDESEEGQRHVRWVSAWNGFMKDLRAFIKDHHTTGLSWTGSEDASAYVGKVAAGGAPAAGGPPAAPPAPAPITPTVDTGSVARGALFAEINAVKDRQKSGATEGLRKVTKEMKTKNQPKSSVVPASATAPKAAPKAAAAPKQPPKLALEGNKWVVEYQFNNSSIVIEETEARQTVYIYKCENSVIQIKGKVNAITIDSCKKTGVVFENAIATAETVNCSSIQLQVTGKVPSIAVDKTSGCQIFLSKDCLDVEIVTSKSDEMNVVLPAQTEGGDIEELPVPEQFKTKVAGRRLVTEAVQHI